MNRQPNRETPPAVSRSSDDGPLSRLLVIDRLEVGPIDIAPKRLKAPYRIHQDGGVFETELVYSYEESVFSPEEPESQNLASMIAAQVALNYGLFCREIVFRGLYDRQDRRLIREMAENTAREIYVNKILSVNPFLTDQAIGLPPVRQKTYLQSRLTFEPHPQRPFRWQLWDTDRTRCAVLSSGGKDSLLTFGLLDELMTSRQTSADNGILSAVHPLFVNESGRHWFTALNAYRHMRDRVPGTGRVWVNSDRLFSWMLRRLPFIRTDFADIRSDNYPIRLWTVAVFLFGILPLMRKNRLGRLLIGDEFDTTVRGTRDGIRHYDGLFDQSIHFDQVLSRYFLKKGWSISAFSILRPLSELLIQKILVERYPDLQRLQTSCHATTMSDQRVLPCGRCEKCRRIVGMLLAIGGDPGACGYSPSQVQTAIKNLTAHGVHQEAEGVEQLLFLLNQRGVLPAPDKPFRSLKERSEIMKLRFHPEKSPIEAIPLDLRRPLFAIFLEHAAGTVLWQNRRWVQGDVWTHPDLQVPYAYETDPMGQTDAGTSGGVQRRSDHRWGEWTWPDAEAHLSAVDIALLPVGAIEQHGPHLPLDTDAFDADYLAHRVAEACSLPRPAVLPLISYGVSYHHRDFCGTISIANDTLAKLVYDIGISAAANGIRKLVIINGHGGNGPALNYAAQMI
ncbi:MAG: creatininase family protein, partial [Desulfobacterales bacterium]